MRLFMRSGLLFAASLFAAALTASFAAPARADIVVNIDKTTQQMSVSVDGQPRYVWPVSTGRRGYDTPNGTFKINRMDADHLSQEWDNAPMPDSMFFDMKGHAIHGFFDVKHLGLAVSHGCVRLAPAHAAVLFNLVKTEGMNKTTVVVSGQTPAGGIPYLAQRRGPVEDASAQPMDIAPRYSQQPPSPYGQPSYYGQAGQRYYYGPQAPQPYYGQARQPYYDRAAQSYGPQRQTYYYGQPGYGQPQYYVVQPYNRY